MFGAGKNSHSQHHDNVGHLIFGSISAFDANMLAQHFGKFELFDEASDEGEAGVAGKIFFGKLYVKSSHHISASSID